MPHPSVIRRARNNKTSKAAVREIAVPLDAAPAPEPHEPELQDTADEIRQAFKLGPVSLNATFVRAVHTQRETEDDVTEYLRLLPGGVARYIHVAAQWMKDNIERGYGSHPTVAVRPVDNPRRGEIYQHAEILGPSSLVYDHERPMPDTDGRAVCVLHTRAPVLVMVHPGRGIYPTRNSC